MPKPTPGRSGLAAPGRAIVSLKRPLDRPRQPLMRIATTSFARFLSTFGTRANRWIDGARFSITRTGISRIADARALGADHELAGEQVLVDDAALGDGTSGARGGRP